MLATDRFEVGRAEDLPAPLRLSADRRLPWRLLFVSMGAGAGLLSLEVIWFRFLRLYVASSPTAFSVMLAVVLFGIGMGGIVSSHDSAARSSITTVAANSLTADGDRVAPFLPIFPGNVSYESNRSLPWSPGGKSRDSRWF